MSQAPATPSARQPRPSIPWAQRPFVTYALLAIIVVIYAITYWIDQTGDPTVPNPIIQFGAIDYMLVTQYGQWYRLFTAMFVHLSLAHIFFNGYALWQLGRGIEWIFGHVHYALIYLLGGLCGSLASLYLTRADSAGASGAIFGLFAAQIVYIMRYRTELGAVGTAALRQLLILVALNFGLDFVANQSQAGAVIDIWAHAGGFIGGGAIAYLLLNSARAPRPVNQ